MNALIYLKQNIELLLNEGLIDAKTCGKVTEWLELLGMIKNEYTEEDLREILNIFIESQEKDKQR